jgi:fibronectin type 3 domain-containing protein
LSEEEFAAHSVQIASVPVTDDDFSLKTMTYNDTLEFAGQPVRLRYAVRLVNASGQKATFSNFLLIEPAATVAAAPSGLSSSVLQDAITLQWTAPTTNINGTTPVNILGYDIYRSESNKQAGKLLNKTPVSETKYSDNFFEFGKNYFYFVRAVSVGSGGVPVESQESNVINVKPVDVFPPSAPTAITLAAAPNNISIFFAVNPEKDIAGYKIYRSTEPDLDKKQWILLTPQLLSTNTFQDTKVESGKTYYYYITATDKTGNVSEPSEVVKETAP